MLTIFSCPKPFTDPHNAIIQRNAITSWTLLQPRPEIILFGDEPGTAKICQELGLRHVPAVARNEYGTPLLNDIFEKAQRLAGYEILCYVNADMILLNDFIEAVKRLVSWPRDFLMVGARWNLDFASEIQEFSKSEANWALRFKSFAQAHARLSRFEMDYFVFRRGLYWEMPPLAIGRFWFPRWLVWKAHSRGADIIDASDAIMAVHQNHNYLHAGASSHTTLWMSEESQRNYNLVGVDREWTPLDATYCLTSWGVRRVWPGWRKAQQHISMALDDLLRYKLGGLRWHLGLRRTTLIRLKSKLSLLRR